MIWSLAREVEQAKKVLENGQAGIDAFAPARIELALRRGADLLEEVHTQVAERCEEAGARLLDTLGIGCESAERLVNEAKTLLGELSPLVGRNLVPDGNPAKRARQHDGAQ